MSKATSGTTGGRRDSVWDTASLLTPTEMTGSINPLTTDSRRRVSFAPQSLSEPDGSQKTDGLPAGTPAPTNDTQSQLTAAEIAAQSPTPAHSVMLAQSGSSNPGTADGQESAGAPSGKESWEELRSVLAKYTSQDPEKLYKEYEELKRALAPIASARRGEERPRSRDYLNYTRRQAFRDARRDWRKYRRLVQQGRAYRKLRKGVFRQV